MRNAGLARNEITWSVISSPETMSIAKELHVLSHLRAADANCGRVLKRAAFANARHLQGVHSAQGPTASTSESQSGRQKAVAAQVSMDTVGVLSSGRSKMHDHGHAQHHGQARRQPADAITSSRRPSTDTLANVTCGPALTWTLAQPKRPVATRKLAGVAPCQHRTPCESMQHLESQTH